MRPHICTQKLAVGAISPREYLWLLIEARLRYNCHVTFRCFRDTGLFMIFYIKHALLENDTT